MTTKKTLQYYMNLNWSYTIELETHNKKKIYIIRVNELPGVCTDADSVEEGMEEIRDGLKAAIQLYMKHGDPIPEPIKKEEYRGNIAYRTTSDRHYHLAKLARQEQKSISKTLDMLIDVGLSKYQGKRL